MEKVFGGLLMGCGILVAGLSGLCTLLVAGTSMLDPSNSEEIMSVIPAALIFGGIPVLIGVGIFFGGRALMRSAKQDEELSPYPPAVAPPSGPVVPAKPPENP